MSTVTNPIGRSVDVLIRMFQLGLAAPPHQIAALASYKQKYTDPTYGNLQTFAATPDIAALGRNLVIYQTISGFPGFYRSVGFRRNWKASALTSGAPGTAAPLLRALSQQPSLL